MISKLTSDCVLPKEGVLERVQEVRTQTPVLLDIRQPYVVCIRIRRALRRDSKSDKNCFSQLCPHTENTWFGFHGSGTQLSKWINVKHITQHTLLLHKLTRRQERPISHARHWLMLDISKCVQMIPKLTSDCVLPKEGVLERVQEVWKHRRLYFSVYGNPT